MGKSTSFLSWGELDETLHYLEAESRYRTIWRISTRNPIDAFFIDEVIKEGWEIEWMDIEGIYGITSYARKKITIAQRLRGYQRDATLFHELVHVRYPDILNDVWGPLADYNSAVCEWIARQCVADTPLLHHALQKFRIESQPYTPEECKEFLPSQEALQKLFKQYWVILYHG